MTVAERQPGTGRSADRRVLVIGIGCVAISLVGVLGNALHLLPSALGVGIVLGALGIGLRVVLMWTARSASNQRREQVLGLLSWVGLGIAAVTLIGVLPRLTDAGGFGLFLNDVVTHAWTIGLLTIGASLVRTMNWKAFLGAGLSGFFGVPALSRLVGRPIVYLLGDDSALAVAFWVPLTEEILKLLPVALVVFLATRRTNLRPSAMDLALMGAWSGAGFALYENGLYGRGGLKMDAFPISLFNPSGMAGDSFLAAGHLVWTAIAALGLGIGLLYLKRWRLLWLAAPIGLGVAVLEHATGNASSLSVWSGGFLGALATIGKVLTLGGWLSALLLIAASVLTVVIEWKNGTRTPVKLWLRIPKDEARRRGEALARLQCGTGETR